MADPSSEFALHEARCVVFDPVQLNRQATLASLYEVGFRDIDTPKSISGLNALLNENLVDLLIVDATVHEIDLCKLIRGMRQGRVGDNVFTLVLATAWWLGGGRFDRIMRAGVDDLLRRPVSIAQIAQRVRAFLATRRPFLVTKPYVGPNHFLTGALPYSTDVIRGRDVDVPNTLVGHSGPNRKIYDAIKEIRKAQTEIKRALLSIEVDRLEDNLALGDPTEVGAVCRRLVSLSTEMDMGEVKALSEAILQLVEDIAQIDVARIKLIQQIIKAIRLCEGETNDEERRLTGAIIQKVEILRRSA